ncbi:hypothetical protein [Raoultibacter timonensis]|uniref:hypothetical protein n=1 Tax=Raoultibacter timonensis TaxID=1907662 RepID=UPI0026DD23EA|nr:hypothetical protein [Raoultibacter timonensis]
MHGRRGARVRGRWKKLDGGGEPPTLEEALFALTLGLCERFPSLDPFAIRRMRFREVFLVVRRLNAAAADRGPARSAVADAGARVPAGDDWF